MSMGSRDERDDLPVVTCEGCMLMCVLVLGLVAAACVGIGSWLLHTYHFELREFLRPAIEAAKTLYWASLTIFF